MTARRRRHSSARRMAADLLDELGGHGLHTHPGSECHHCGCQHWLVHVVLPDEQELSNFWTAYECLRCGATELLGDRRATHMPPLFP